MSDKRRRGILHAVMDKSGADALIETFRSKGSIVYREKDSSKSS
jgi:hypothetical protein